MANCGQTPYDHFWGALLPTPDHASCFPQGPCGSQDSHLPPGLCVTLHCQTTFGDRDQGLSPSLCSSIAHMGLEGALAPVIGLWLLLQFLLKNSLFLSCSLSLSPQPHPSSSRSWIWSIAQGPEKHWLFSSMPGFAPSQTHCGPQSGLLVWGLTSRHSLHSSGDKSDSDVDTVWVPVPAKSHAEM